MEPLDAAEVRRRVPDLAASAIGMPAAFCPDEGYCDTARFVAEALGRARRSGAVLRIATAVRVIPAERGVDVLLEDGSVLAADRALIATGTWTEALLASSGFRLPLYSSTAPGSAQFGFLATTEPLPVALDPVLTTTRLNLRTEGHGRLTVQALDLDAEADPAARFDTDGPVGEELAARLRVVLDLPYRPPLASLRVGVRPMPADGLTASGYVDDTARIYVTVTHSGITLAPILGRLAATELAGDPSPLLDDFRPSRFADGRSGHAPGPARYAGEQ